MRVLLVPALVAVIAANGGCLSAQEALVRPGPAADSAFAEPRPPGWRRGPVLPPALAVEPGASAEAPALRAGEGPVPAVSGIFGALAGMFVANWWVRRDCEENCDEERLYMLFIGGTIGAAVGWLAGGGDLPDPSPPDPRRGPP